MVSRITPPDAEVPDAPETASSIVASAFPRDGPGAPLCPAYHRRWKKYANGGHAKTRAPMMMPAISHEVSLLEVVDEDEGLIEGEGLVEGVGAVAVVGMMPAFAAVFRAYTLLSPDPTKMVAPSLLTAGDDDTAPPVWNDHPITPVEAFRAYTFLSCDPTKIVSPSLLTASDEYPK